MKSIATLTLGSLLAAGSALAGNSVRGEYVEARTADVYVGACFANSEAGLVGELAVMGWKISKGTFNGVNLDGLYVAGAVKASATLGDVHASAYPVKSVLIIDERANVEQRLALRAFAQKMAGDLLNDIVKIEYAPISLTFANNNLHSATATFKAGNLAEIQTRPIQSNDKVCAHEEIWYSPLTKVGHAMPAFAMSHGFKGKGLGTSWSSPDKRSAFVADFQLND
ncbi:MAG: DUF1326 domain-containing protein [Acidobacteria bacterium]|nr:DUF1326 domain-containing protein [Acidobacteriota bacterium]